MSSCNQTPPVKSRPLLAPPPAVPLLPGQGHSGLCLPPSQTDGSTGRPPPHPTSHIMDVLHIPPLEEEGEAMEVESQGNGEQEEGGKEASSPMGSATDEETDEDSEPEPPPVIRRKVSFADAFGLNLVSVKEFDNPEVAESEVNRHTKNEATHHPEEFYVSCLFTVPSSPEELEQRLREQMVELESIELLPGTTTLRGTVRVVNLCYTKSVYARMSLDRWTSFFDLSAEYVPGSSDWKTDRFTFQHTLVPPFEREGTRVEICLRYETSVGTFWANCKEMNYVLFCHQKGHVKEHEVQVQEESIGCNSKRSCLKANRRGCAEEKTRKSSIRSTAVADGTLTAEEANGQSSSDVQSLLYWEEHTPLVESIKSRNRAERMARVQGYLSQRGQHVAKAHSHDSANGQKVSQPLSTLWGHSSGFFHKQQRKHPAESPQVLTYHQIPLLTLDWNSDKARKLGAADRDDIRTGGAKMNSAKAPPEKMADTHPVSDATGIFRNGADDTFDKKSSVCNVWQAFVNGLSCADQSGVPESEWLQTAALVSPSNEKGPNARCAASSHEHECPVGTDAPATSHAHTSDSCQPLSDTRQIATADAGVNSEDHRPAEACVGTPRDDTQDASQRSQTSSVTDTPREFCVQAATPVSEGRADSSAECHERAMREREREARAEGIGRDGPSAPRAADFVTSSGESGATDMTATPESENATAADKIWRGARPDEGFSPCRDGEVRGAAHNAMDDTLAFRGTIRRGTGDGERFVFSASRQGMEERSVENRGAADEEIFRPRKTAECKSSQRCAEEKQQEEFRLNQNREDPLQAKERGKKEIRVAKTNADESNSSQTYVGQSQVMAGEFILEESERQDVASSNKDVEVSKKTEVEACSCTAINEIKTLTGVEEGIIQGLNEEHQRNSSWKTGNTSIILGVHNKQTTEHPTVTQMQGNALESETDEQALVSNQTEEGKYLSYEGIIAKQLGINRAPPWRHAVESKEIKKVFQGDHDTFRHSLTDKCSQKPVEVRWTHSRDDTKGPNQDGGRETTPEEANSETNVAKKDTSTEPEHRPETLKRRKEDLSRRDGDDSASIGKLKIEVPGELMGNAEIARGETENAAAELKGHEMSAEVESSSRVEYKKLSAGTKDPITAESAAALEARESGWEEVFIERFGDDLVRRIWGEAFCRKERAANRDTDIVDGMRGELADIPDIAQDCRHPFEKDFNDAFESGALSLTHLPADQNVSQGLEPTLATKGNAYPPDETRSSLTTTAEQTRFLSAPQTDLNSRANLCGDFGPVSAVGSSPSLTETGRPIEDLSAAHVEDFNPSPRASHKHLSSASDMLKETHGVPWRSVLYALGQVTRLLICILLVAGFSLIVFLSDFQAFFALYVVSSCWWFYEWKRHRVMKSRGIVA
ncbi:uncharacterized protein ppp1r3aa [Gasterosteus aculeatus]